MSTNKVICHATGERCLGCDHYHGKAPLCRYAKKELDSMNTPTTPQSTAPSELVRHPPEVIEAAKQMHTLTGEDLWKAIEVITSEPRPDRATNSTSGGWPWSDWLFAAYRRGGKVLQDALACAEAEREQYRASGIRQWDEFRLSEQELRDELKSYKDAVDAQPWATDEPIRVLLDRITERLQKAEARLAKAQSELDGDREACKALSGFTFTELAGELSKLRSSIAVERQRREKVERELAEARKALVEIADECADAELLYVRFVLNKIINRHKTTIDSAREAGKGQP